MLTSFLIHLKPQYPTPLRPPIGRTLHGLFFQLINQADPKLAELLHEPLRTKPFTVSSLWGDFAHADGYRIALPEHVYKIRYTVLAERLFDLLGEVLLDHYLTHQPLIIAQQPFEIVQLDVAPRAKGRWLRTTSYHKLLRPRQPEEITLHFASPTAFKNGQITHLFPTPTSVFASYYRAWQAFSGHPLSDDLISFVEESVVVSRFRLQTKVIDAGRHKLLGFVGRCTFKILETHPVHVAELNTLAEFAFFCGTGMKTTQGMGQTRRVYKERKREQANKKASV